ncbi:MAG: NAD-dependent succinate-semialdehyde dehydrogenase [Methanobacteriota archaeon]|nr:MAG: NAD-dependent succinate-semialdehyde dehydrogenase [Euryarchaeota archaeon]
MKVKSINPATMEVIQEYDLFSDEKVNECLLNAQTAFEEWRKQPLSVRKELLKKLAHTIRAMKEEVAVLMAEEMGKPIRQARAELEKCAWTCEVYADKAEKWLAEEEIKADGLKHLVILQPLGVILGIMPWNFPIWQVIRWAVPAILVGNTALLKHSNTVPGCAIAIEKMFRNAGFPEGVFTTLLIDHQQVEWLISQDQIRGVSLTGSTEAGAKVAEIAGRHLKKVVLELGGSDPFIILEDADLDFVIPNAVIGRTQNNGQSCIAAKRFIVHRSIADEFSRRFAEALAKLRIGDPRDEETDIGPMATQGEYSRMKDILQDVNEKGARTTCELPEGIGYFVKPGVVFNADEGLRAVKEEVFGPLAPILTFETDEEAIALANKTDFGLGGSVWTKDLERGKRIAMEIQAGSVFVNCITKSDPRVPFGGIKKSGYGKELSWHGLREFANVKSLNIYDHS